MNTREIAEEYRMSHWAGIMRERKESGQSIRAYCRQAGIHENVYYYWQKKLREAAYEELAEREALQPVAPEGWALCSAEAKVPAVLEKGETVPPDQITVEVNGLRIAAGSDYPVEKLTLLLRELVKPC